ncbi:family 1 glycosyl transferase [Paenibacillus sp. 32O-W]|uniref:hypothetical protein n=1 Tax=Paenibacillus sp. 32O-W TaxID=1695218 RepID=UPI0007225CC1|nr:hypothetical protein [Paenibacillus sp. 32O-W]ALS25940.1 family 1 glycosyl transferase [Paenibacillus sp. 32O-W]
MKILYFSTVNWMWIKQRPHFIPYYLSKRGHEVDFLSLNPLGKVKVKNDKFGSLKIIDKYVLPFALRYRFIELINETYIKSHVYKNKYDVIVLTSPLHYKYIPNHMLLESSIIYECMDNIPFFYTGELRERFLYEERRTLEFADAIITSSDALADICRDRLRGDSKKPIVTIYNAFDKETFSSRPKEIDLDKPNMVYIGTIGEWLDWGTLERFAIQHSDYTVYLIGPEEIRRDLPRNIILVGSVPHYKVIDYIYSGDIMLLPFQINELTRAVDPVKLYEYLYMNKPTISSYWPELDKFQSRNLMFYENYDQFESHALNIVSRVTENNDGDRQEYEFIRNSVWENRVIEYDGFIQMVHKEKREVKQEVERRRLR